MDAGKDDTDDEANDLDIKRATEELLRMGATQLEANARRRWEAGQLQRLGAKGPKNQKLPLSVHVGMKRKSKERYVKEQQRALEVGMPVKRNKGKDRPAGKRSVKGGHWVDKSSIEDTRFRNGVLRVTAPRP